jgi:O-antigen ligase
VLAGLFLSGILAMIQSKTGFGFENPPTFRDIFGYAPYGFQPDLHAYAGYTLLGAVGLWGYYSITKTKLKKIFILLVIALSWYGLMASISKSSIFFALIVSLGGLFWWIFNRYKKISISALPKFSLFLSALIGLLFLAIPYDLVGTPNYLKYLYQTFSKLHWSNFNEISIAFSNRPSIWLAAFRMWEIVPIFGVGQGDFYQLSHLFNINHVPDLVIGENTHNYFLQTLTETGLVGVLAFAVAIITPFLLVRNGRSLMPAALALFSLFLGNIFAHSFLVRENLFLAAIFLGLMYSYAPQEKLTLSPYKLLASRAPKLPWKVMLSLSFIIIIGFGIREVYKSFYSFPFQYGTLCFVNKPLTSDGWSSGLYEIPLPVGSKGVELAIRVARPNLQKHSLSASFYILDSSNRVLTSETLEWRENGPQRLFISMPNGAVIQDAGFKAALRLSSCYTPRNLGESIDGRRLGVIVDSSIIH